MIEESLVTALKEAWPNLKVYPVTVAEGVDPPFASYRVVDRDENAVTFEIDAAAISGLTTEGYRQSKLLFEAITNELKAGFTFTSGCAWEGELVKSTDEYDNVVRLHWTRSQYRLILDTNPY